MLQRCSLAVFLAFASTAPVSADAARQDPAAVAVAERAMAAMGGQGAMESAQLLRFDFVIEREGKELVRFHHWWDRQGGRYRLEGTKPESALPLRVLFDLETRQGEAWIGERRLEGDELRAEIDKAYARFINDSYWLLMPWKWLDPGVRLTYEGERLVDDRLYDVVQLSFDSGVGLTSGDRYWGFVAQDSNLMEIWEYVLQQEDGSPGEAEPTRWQWREWKDIGMGVKLSGRRDRAGEGPAVSIRFPVLEVISGLDQEDLEELLRPRGPVVKQQPEGPENPEEAGAADR